MTRNDVRLLVAIVITAALSSIFTVIVARLLAPTSTDARFSDIEQRVSALEAPPPSARITVVEPPPIPPIPPVPPVPPIPPIPPIPPVALAPPLPPPPRASDPGAFLSQTSLDRVMISDGLRAVRDAALACGTHSEAKGIVKLAVKVAPTGEVSAVTVKDTPEATLGACVATAVQHARFAPTTNGGTFTYPYVF